MAAALGKIKPWQLRNSIMMAINPYKLKRCVAEPIHMIIPKDACMVITVRRMRSLLYFFNNRLLIGFLLCHENVKDNTKRPDIKRRMGF
jgi:hypothetical protein